MFSLGQIIGIIGFVPILFGLLFIVVKIIDICTCCFGHTWNDNYWIDDEEVEICQYCDKVRRKKKVQK